VKVHSRFIDFEQLSPGSEIIAIVNDQELRPFAKMLGDQFYTLITSYN